MEVDTYPQSHLLSSINIHISSAELSTCLNLKAPCAFGWQYRLICLSSVNAEKLLKSPWPLTTARHPPPAVHCPPSTTTVHTVHRPPSTSHHPLSTLSTVHRPPPPAHRPSPIDGHCQLFMLRSYQTPVTAEKLPPNGLWQLQQKLVCPCEPAAETYRHGTVRTYHGPHL